MHCLKTPQTNLGLEKIRKGNSMKYEQIYIEFDNY